MLKLLIYGYTLGVRSSRGIEKRCVEDVAFRYLGAGSAPDYRSVARFRRRPSGGVGGMFEQALQLWRKAGLAKLGRVALDGSKLRANASRHRAMSYGRMEEREASLAAEVEQMLAEAERIDQEEDERLGKDNRGADLQGELARRESRLALIRKAQAELEEEARGKAAEAAAQKATDKGQSGAELAAAAATAASKAVPDKRAQRNATDPDSKIMKTSDGAFHQCYGQLAVDSGSQVIVAAELTACAADAPHLQPMLGAIEQGCDERPKQLIADAGYCSEANLKATAGGPTEVLIATCRLKHGELAPPAPRGRLPAGLTLRELMARKLRTKPGRGAYARRKAMVEPVVGQLKTLQDAGRLLLRGEVGGRGRVEAALRLPQRAQAVPGRRRKGPAGSAAGTRRHSATNLCAAPHLIPRLRRPATPSGHFRCWTSRWPESLPDLTDPRS